MSDLQKEIADCFQAKFIPIPAHLVKLDGFDPCEKERAIKFFSGKSWTDVFDHLRSLENTIIFGAAFHLEEWSVLEPCARHYYLRAYLEFLLETLTKNKPDQQYVSNFFHQLYQTVYMYRNKAYSKKQKSILHKIAIYSAEKTENHEGIGEWKNDIIDNISVFLTELENNESTQ